MTTLDHWGLSVWCGLEKSWSPVIHARFPVPSRRQIASANAYTYPYYFLQTLGQSWVLQRSPAYTLSLQRSVSTTSASMLIVEVVTVPQWHPASSAARLVDNLLDLWSNVLDPIKTPDNLIKGRTSFIVLRLAMSGWKPHRFMKLGKIFDCLRCDLLMCNSKMEYGGAPFTASLAAVCVDQLQKARMEEFTERTWMTL